MRACRRKRGACSPARSRSRTGASTSFSAASSTGRSRALRAARRLSERVTHVVGAGARLAEPAAREQRAHDVTAVTDDVECTGPRVRAQCGGEHERRLRRLLDAAQVADEAETAHPLEDLPELLGRVLYWKSQQLGNGLLERMHLAEIDESRLRPHRIADEP